MRARIGPYRVVRTLGDGGMGRVYEGFSDGRQRSSALKTLNPAQGADPDVLRRLRAEVHTQAAFHHPNVVGVYELIEDAGDVFIALEYVEGTTLAELLAERQGSGLPPEEALRLGGQLLTALEYVHEQGMVHRNVKLANVILSEGRVRLMDAGIARLGDILRPTAASVPLGTPIYMSPEQLQDLEVDCRTDLYSAAVVLYEMLAGRPPFGSGPHPALMGRQLEEGLAALRALVPALHAGVCQVIATMLREKPQERYQTAGELLRALEEGAAGFLPAPPVPPPASPGAAAAPRPVEPVVRQPSPPPPSPLSSTRPHRRWLAAAVLCLLLGGLGAWALWRTLDTSPPPAPQVVPSPVAHPEPPPLPEPSPSPVLPPAPTPDPVEAARRELDLLRAELREGFAAVETDLRAKRYTLAGDRLDRLNRLVQSRTVELQPEGAEIHRLRRRLTDARVAERIGFPPTGPDQPGSNSQGYVAWIEEVAVVPSQLPPGQTAKFSVRFLVLGPDPLEDIAVRVVRVLEHGDEKVEKEVTSELTVQPGGETHTVSGTITIRTTFPPGHYGVKVVLEDPRGRFAAAVGSGSLEVTAGPVQP